jgi:hypothetical protein
MYRIEIHSACILGDVVRMPKSQVDVYYPRITPSTEADAQAWISGWNYITDLFRLLEYAMLSMRVSKTRKPVLSSFCETPLFSGQAESGEAVDTPRITAVTK